MDEATFQNQVIKTLAELPEEFKKQLKNVEFIVEDEPDHEQRKLLKLKRYQSLYGLYTGVPQIVPGEDRATMPDRITLFRLPIVQSHETVEGINRQIKDTLYHEIGHYFGISESRLRQIQKES